MDHRYLVTCMPTSDTARSIYFDVLKPLVAQNGRLRLISYLDFPIRDEFDREIRTWIHLSNGVVAIIDKLALNVIYEVGVAVGFGKPVILLAPSVDDVPAMLRARNVIIFPTGKTTNEHIRTKVSQAVDVALHGNFIDQRFQDHTAVLINNKDVSASKEDDSLSTVGLGIEPDELELGISEYRLKNYKKAVTHLERAMEAGNRDADTYFYLADAYFFLGESLRPGEKQRSAYQKMQHFAREGTKFHQNDKRLKKTLGLSYMKLGDFERAEKIFVELLAEDPEYIVAAYNLACLHALQGQRSHCLRFLSEVFRKNSAWRYLARVDSDFDGIWEDELLQRILFPCPIHS